MPIVAFALIGFIAGLGTMVIVSLYKHVFKTINN
jgi:hypothetical protein